MTSWGGGDLARESCRGVHPSILCTFVIIVDNTVMSWMHVFKGLWLQLQEIYKSSIFNFGLVLKR